MVLVLLLLIGGFLLAIGATIFGGFFLMRLPSGDARMANWRQVAKKMRAEISVRGWWRQFPALRLSYREARFVVFVQAARGVEWTRLSLKHSSLDGRATLSSAALANDLETHPQAAAMTLIDDLARHNWSGWTVVDSRGDRRMNPVVQSQLVQLQHAVHPYHLQCRLSPGLLEIDVDQPLWSFDAVRQLLRTGMAIYDQFLLTTADGIAFVEGDDVRPLEAVNCRICGESIESDLVACRACKTPHHRECWEYNGQCSTYACGEAVYLMPQAGEVKR